MRTHPQPDAAAGRQAQERWHELFADTAYVLPIRHDDATDYGIFNADGAPLAIAPTRALAQAVIRKYAMRPVDAH